MLYFIIGTKAQFIKMAPVMREATDRNLRWRVVDLGQHADITGRILEDFGLNADVTQVFPNQQTVADYRSAAFWIMRLVGHITFPSGLRKRIFPEPGVALVHGDTLSTLAGTLLARRLKLKVGLIEAGLTSGRLWSPFPEEIVRRICERTSHALFAPDADAANRLHARTRKAKIFDTRYNTGRDALLMKIGKSAPSENFALVTLHRLETLGNSRRLDRAVAYIEEVAKHLPVVLVLHPPTRKALESPGHLRRLEHNVGVKLVDLLPYPDFLQLLSTARIVFTDGGSVQEECSYLGKKCVVLRDVTERGHGLGVNALLTRWSVPGDLDRLSALAGRTEHPKQAHLSASRTIIDAALAMKPLP